MTVIGIRCTENEEKMVADLAKNNGVSLGAFIRTKIVLAYAAAKNKNFRCPEISCNLFEEGVKNRILHARVPEFIWNWIILEANCNEISATLLVRYIIFNT